MTFEQLKDKANSLPLVPGVYIMRDKSDKVIYVGKAKKLKNRVSQYFQDTASHTPKTRLMVSHIDHFDVIAASSEFEALILECSLIKRHMPKYNILLKDDKGYPYLRLDMKEIYPVITLAPKLNRDEAEYFGPFGTRHNTIELMKAIREVLKLPDCSRQFPRDVGKDRPCLNYHMNRCEGWCQESRSCTEYRERMLQARQLLQGNYKDVASEIKEKMLQAAENLEFEIAAKLRDRLNAVEQLGKKQLVTAGSLADTDVVGYAERGGKACFTVLHFSGGNLLDKEYEVFQTPDEAEEAVSGLLKQFYLSRGIAPKIVLLPFELEDAELFAQLMEQEFGRKTKLRVPQRGDNMRLVELAQKNAAEEAERAVGREEKHTATLVTLGKMLGMEPPERIESYDISNISGTDIVASEVVFVDGKPSKKDYKKYKLEGLDDQDDYASMHQVLTRRFHNYKAGEKGFEIAPDLLLIDGGVAHAGVAVQVLSELGLSFPVFGMVKDDRHRTRALVTPEGREIRIDNNQAIFALIGNIQEETHRFAITYHRQLRSKRLSYSELDGIPGIGPKRKQDLLKTFKSLTAMRAASLMELERILPRDAARAVYKHFHEEDEIMRVVAGSARGTVLKTPEGMLTRPTADRVKEAVFSILHFDVQDAVVLDLFGGTGQLGIEALSRGARRAVFVDHQAKACELIKENLKRTKFTNQGSVVRGDYLEYLKRTKEKFDIILLDPPYAEIFLENALNCIAEIDILRDNGIIVTERPVEKALELQLPGFIRSRDYKYGKTLVTLYRREGEGEE